MLVDTGGEINLIRTGLIPTRFIRPTKEVYDMRTVNGQSMEGGKTTVNMKLYFNEEMDGEILGDELIYKATFREANIEVEAILSHSWLLKKR